MIKWIKNKIRNYRNMEFDVTVEFEFSIYDVLAVALIIAFALFIILR